MSATVDVQLDSATEDAAYQAWLVRLAFPAENAASVARVVYVYAPKLTEAQMAQALRRGGDRPVFPDLKALEMGRVLKDSVFPNISPADMGAALKAAGYPQADVDDALAQLFPPPPPVQTSVLRFDGSGTYVTLSHNDFDQIGYRDAGHRNQLTNLDTTGYTIDASIYPEAADDRPIVSLVCDMAGAQWKPGDLAYGVSLFEGHVRLSAFTADWNAGMASDYRLVTITSKLTVPLSQWSHITAIWEYGGLLSLYFNGEQVRELDVQNNHDSANQYNRNAFEPNGYKVCVYASPIWGKRFAFGGLKDRFFKGFMKEIRIWNGPRNAEVIRQDPHRRLTDAEVAAAQANSTGTQYYPSYLAGYWPLDDGSGGIAHDLTKVRNDGRIQNPLWAKPPA